MYQPNAYAMGFQPYQQAIHGFIYVSGIEGARAYPLPPGSEMPLFDSQQDGVMYVKQTDAVGVATIKVIDCKERVPVDEVAVAKDELTKMYSDLAGQIEHLKEVVNGLVPKTAEPDAGLAAGR